MTRTPTRHLLLAPIALAALAIFGYGAWRVYRHFTAGPLTGPSATVAADTSRIKSIQLGGSPAVIAWPKRPTNRVVLYTHGAGANQWTVLGDPELRGLATTLLRNGYAIASSDAYGNAWGDAASVNANRALIRDLQRSQFDRFYVLAQSMGGLDGMAAIDLAPIQAWIGIFPVCNLTSMLSGSYGPEIRQLYRTDITQPVRIASDVRGLPMLFFASPQDTTVSKAMNTDLCAAQLRAHGANVTVISTRGNHGDPSNFQPARVTQFLRRS